MLLLLLMAVWGGLFYYAIIDEVMDETDDTLENYSEILINNALMDPSILDTEGTLMSFYKFRPISEEEAEDYDEEFYDSTVYIESEDEDEPVRVLKTAFRMPDGQFYELELMISILERDDMVEAILWYLGALFLLFLICTSIGTRLILQSVFRQLHRLLNWLETTDFFTAPASTRFHGACECGLVMHSINVYNAMMQHFFTEGESAESYAICGLLHDLCKANFYKVGTRNVKNDVTGQWEKVPFYQVADQLPYGHGEKSVYLIEHFMRLKTAEAIAIRWHMGGFDDAVRGGSFAVSDAYNTYPLAVKLHIADLTATYLMEQGTSEVENGHPKSK